VGWKGSGIDEANGSTGRGNRFLRGGVCAKLLFLEGGSVGVWEWWEVVGLRLRLR